MWYRIPLRHSDIWLEQRGFVSHAVENKKRLLGRHLDHLSATSRRLEESVIGTNLSFDVQVKFNRLRDAYL